MMYPRLFLARQLLREDGVIFVSIDDHEVHNLRMLMNEVFGEENLVVNIAWQKKVSPSNDAKWFSDDHDYLLVYARSKQTWRPMRLQMNERQKGYYTNPDNDPRGCWNSATYTCNKTREQRPNLYYPLINPTTGEEVWPRETAVWAYSKELHKKHVEEKLLYWGKDGKARMPRLKTFLSNAGNVVPRSVWLYSEVGHTQEATKDYLNVFPEGGFETPKPLRLIKRMLQVATVRSSPDLILDFFAGSATTAQAVLDLNREDGGNRRFILVQLPEPTGRKDFPTIADIGKERIRRVIAKLKKEKAARLPSGETEDLGFRVFKLAESHHKLWAGIEEKEPTGYAKEMDLFKDPLLPGWTPENLIWEVALKEGFGLNSTIEKLDKVKHGIFYRVTDPDKDQHFTLCLGETLHADDLKILNLSKEDLFICRDIALTDELAANVALQCRLKTI
jgi:adenine-specific DNA-methyltransferase